MSDGLYSLEEVSFSAYLQEIGALRIRAWRNEPGVDPSFFARQSWIEPLDHSAYHWVVTRHSVVVAAARLSFHSSLDSVPYSSLLPNGYRDRYDQKTIASINRLVVDPGSRGMGLAASLDKARLEMANREGVDVVLAQPQLNRLNSLKRQGFEYLCELQRTPEMPDRPLFFMELDLRDRHNLWSNPANLFNQ